jgi:hypothetical protein
MRCPKVIRELEIRVLGRVLISYRSKSQQKDPASNARRVNRK